MEDFIKEVKEMPTADIMLILEDQQDLYSKEELSILQNELKSRPSNAFEIEFEENERKIQIQEQLEKEKRAEELYRHKIDSLKSKGYDGY